MITREEVIQVLFILNSEFDGVLKGDEVQDNLKINMWHELLQDFTFPQVQSATKQLLSSKVYGKPNISDLMAILKPEPIDQNEGAEFAQSIFDLQQRLGTDNMGEKVREVWGDIGYSIYRQIRSELRELLIEDVPTFKAQLRNLYNSYKEREKRGNLGYLPHVEGKDRMIEIDGGKIGRIEVNPNVFGKPNLDYGHSEDRPTSESIKALKEHLREQFGM